MSLLNIEIGSIFPIFDIKFKTRKCNINSNSKNLGMHTPTNELVILKTDTSLCNENVMEKVKNLTLRKVSILATNNFWHNHTPL